MYNRKQEFKHDISAEGYRNLGRLGNSFLLPSWALLVLRSLVHFSLFGLIFNVFGVGFWLWVIGTIWQDFSEPDLRRGGAVGWSIGLVIGLAFVVYACIALGGWLWFDLVVSVIVGILWFKFFRYYYA
ncbi:hypothetical protein [Lacticaseibacillus kribbianus]|uniref:hypothetical protein n=1 Tax=Lacticaseibacillus kribbianus TaxID=2926292 RepID=UPI001CD584A6|nr:hypothetical protein [Lacticaseibacillus kribbianus]